MDSISLKAYAKINLGLDVCGVLPNGYHEVRMIMQSVNLFDNIYIKKIQDNEIKIKNSVSFLPSGEKNLMYKAAELIKQQCEIKDGVFIKLDKHIPVAAGMAGGSTDAAAVLIGMNKLFELDFSLEKLMELGLKIGSDVPFCLMRGTALAEGIGEKLTRLPAPARCSVVIAKPYESASTAAIYKELDDIKDYTHPDIDGIIKGIREQNLLAMCQSMGNVLELVTGPKVPAIRALEELMIEEGAVSAMMTGSGPTVFGIFAEPELAKKAAQRIKKSGLARNTFVSRFFTI